MVTKQAVDLFFSKPVYALAGVSRSKAKFGNSIYQELVQHGYQVYILHPEATMLEGAPCYPNLSALPEKIHGLIVNVNPLKAVPLVQEAANLGIQNIWLQQGSESPAVLKLCQEKGLNTISRECILMHAQPVKSIHGFHRWIMKVFNQLPK